MPGLRDKRLINKSRLRRLLGLFFVALAIPTATLAWQAYSRLKWESFHRYQLRAEELVGRIDRRLSELIAKEEARTFADYGFLVVEGAPVANYLQRSPLSGYPVRSDIPGLLGYFQIDAQGRFTTPLLPDERTIAPLTYGIVDAELDARRGLRDRLLLILSQDTLTTGHAAQQPERKQAAATGSARPATPDLAAGDRDALLYDSKERAKRADAPTAAGQAVGAEVREQKLAQTVFDRLAEEPIRRRADDHEPVAGRIGRIDDLQLARPYHEDARKQSAEKEPTSKNGQPPIRTARRERSVLPSPTVTLAPDRPSDEEAAGASVAPTRVRIFESEIDPFETGRLASGHLVLYRKIWRDGQRYIQGALIDTDDFLQGLIEAPFRDTGLSDVSRMAVAFEGDILTAIGDPQSGRYLSSAEQLTGSLLYRGRLSAPLGQLETLFTVTRLPAGPGAMLVTWVAAILALILSGGLILMYRLGVKQIELSQQQRDFVSAVSHELKTPLTSIRMYSEMLREGWADEARKRSYYEFIHDESERLSRLITNVLQLARLGREEIQVELRPVAVAQLLDTVRSKLATQIERAGFELRVHGADDVLQRCIEVDDDALTQIFINLADNAVKFAPRADTKTIEVGCERLGDDRIRFRIRDYGPGIQKSQMKKIFLLFYRPENELTREAVGTGIGLALVHRLMSAMHGEVDVVNREPGAEFRLTFPALPSGT